MGAKMPDNVKELAQCLPFMLPAAGVAVESQRVNQTRVIEAVIIAAFTGVLGVLGVWFMLIPEMKAENRAIAASVAEIKTAVIGLQRDVSKLKVDVVDDRFRRSDFERWNNRHEEIHRDHRRHHDNKGH